MTERDAWEAVLRCEMDPEDAGKMAGFSVVLGEVAEEYRPLYASVDDAMEEIAELRISCDDLLNERDEALAAAEANRTMVKDLTGLYMELYGWFTDLQSEHEALRTVADNALASAIELDLLATSCPYKCEPASPAAANDPRD